MCCNFSCNEGDINALHKKEMLEAAEKAKEEYLKDHPEVEDIDMKYDPVKLLEKCKYSYLSGKNKDENFTISVAMMKIL